MELLEEQVRLRRQRHNLQRRHDQLLQQSREARGEEARVGMAGGGAVGPGAWHLVGGRVVGGAGKSYVAWLVASAWLNAVGTLRGSA